MTEEDFISGGETTTTGGIVSTIHKERRCTHLHSISGIQRWCDKGVFPPDCATCTQGDWEEYWVEVTSRSTNNRDRDMTREDYCSFELSKLLKEKGQIDSFKIEYWKGGEE